ncbi:MAG: secondary thiamine-phosphate synthase enzyme YjbQ [Chloroflexota bacterium]|nr:secondary thiamine-phosphate synthase enzyme YjbQ [Chloroflexota bacterium]
MTVRHGDFELRTSRREETHDVTAKVADVVTASGVREGLCVIAVAHTTVGVFVNENADPDVQRDLLLALGSVVPDQGDYRHAEGNSPAHVKAVLVGSSVTLPVRDGRLALGTWQGIFVAEFDGPRVRRATVTVSGEARLDWPPSG